MIIIEIQYYFLKYNGIMGENPWADGWDDDPYAYLIQFKGGDSSASEADG